MAASKKTAVRPSAKAWATQLRRLVRSAHGAGWVLREHRGGRTQISRQWADGSRSSVTVTVPWLPSSGPALLALVERLAALMAPPPEGQGLALAQAAAQIDGTTKGRSAAAIRAGTIDWPVAIDLFRRHLVEVTGQVKASTWAESYRRHMAEVLQVLTQRPAPRTGRDVLAALVRAHPTPPGNRGRRERLGNSARFLRFAVANCGADPMYLPPTNYSDLIGVRAESKTPATPLLDDQVLRLLAGVSDPQWRLAVGLAAVFGLRPVEFGCCRADGSVLRVDGVKRTRHGPSGARIVEALDPEGAAGLGDQLLSVLAERGREALPPDRPPGGAPWSTRLQQHLSRHCPAWDQIKAEAMATGQGRITSYGLRHSFAWRGSQLYGLSPRVLSSLMGHTVAVHLQHYGQWSSEAETRAAVAAARDRVVNQYRIGGEKGIPLMLE
jgi:integrase